MSFAKIHQPAKNHGTMPVICFILHNMTMHCFFHFISVTDSFVRFLPTRNPNDPCFGWSLGLVLEG